MHIKKYYQKKLQFVQILQLQVIPMFNIFLKGADGGYSFNIILEAVQ